MSEWEKHLLECLNSIDAVINDPDYSDIDVQASLKARQAQLTGWLLEVRHV